MKAFNGIAGMAADSQEGNFLMEHLGQHHLEWLENRGLDAEIATRYGLYSDKQSSDARVLVIPHIRNGEIVNRKFRATNEKKFWMDQGGEICFWNEDILKDESLEEDPLIVTEGEFDAIAAIQSGFPKSVSVPNGVNSNLDFISERLECLPTQREIIIAVDRDEAGAKLGKRLLSIFGEARCSYLRYPKDCKDLNEVAEKYGNGVVYKIIQDRKEYPVSGIYTLSCYPDVGVPKTYSTGWSNLDNVCTLWRGEFMPVTGIPASGKSTVMKHMIANVCTIHNHRAALYTPEMPIVPYVRNLFREHFAGRQNIHYNWRDADAWIEDKITFIDPAPVNAAKEYEDPTLEWLIERAEIAVMRRNIDWLLIDPWNQISHDMRRESSAEYQRRAIMKLKQFARGFDCGVIVIAHPTKDVKLQNGKIRVPNLYDIDGSAHWFNAADHGLIIDRDPKKTQVKIINKKCRFRNSGSVGDAYLNYNQSTLRFDEISPPTDYDNFDE